MEDNKEEKTISTEELKNETLETAKKIRESVKNTNIKDETKATKNIIVEMFKNPLDKIKEVATDKSDNFFRTAIILVILWTVAVFISSSYRTIYLWGFSRVFENILSVLKTILAPALGIIVYSIIILLLNKNNKKSLITTISTVTITKIPMIISAVFSLLIIIDSKISVITTIVEEICLIITTILGYFGIKYLFEEEDNTFIKKYILIQIIYYISYIIISFLGIYI